MIARGKYPYWRGTIAPFRDRPDVEIAYFWLMRTGQAPCLPYATVFQDRFWEWKEPWRSEWFGVIGTRSMEPWFGHVAPQDWPGWAWDGSRPEWWSEGLLYSEWIAGRYPAAPCWPKEGTKGGGGGGGRVFTTRRALTRGGGAADGRGRLIGLIPPLGGGGGVGGTTQLTGVLPDGYGGGGGGGQGEVDDTMLPGSIAWWPSPVVPSGWLPCDGAAVSRVTYAALMLALRQQWNGSTGIGGLTITSMSLSDLYVFGYGCPVEGPGWAGTHHVDHVIGTGSVQMQEAHTADALDMAFYFYPYGNGDGSTTFNVPDLRGAFILGGHSGIVAPTYPHYLGETGGEEEHQLTVAELAVHKHKILDTGVTNAAPGVNYWWPGPNPTVTDTSAEGGDAPHNNMPPFAVVRFIIKT